MSNNKMMNTTIATLIFTATLGVASVAIAADVSTVAEHSSNNHYLLAYADKSDAGKDPASGEPKHGQDGKMSGDGDKHHMHHGKYTTADSDKDGKISKEEFIKYHEAKFEKKDLNNDGFIDKDEMQKMMKKHMHGHGKDQGHKKKEMGDKTHGDM